MMMLIPPNGKFVPIPLILLYTMLSTVAICPRKAHDNIEYSSIIRYLMFFHVVASFMILARDALPPLMRLPQRQCKVPPPIMHATMPVYAPSQPKNEHP